MKARRPTTCARQKNNIFRRSYLKKSLWNWPRERSLNGFDDADQGKLNTYLKFLWILQLSAGPSSLTQDTYWWISTWAPAITARSADFRSSVATFSSAWASPQFSHTEAGTPFTTAIRPPSSRVKVVVLGRFVSPKHPLYRMYAKYGSLPTMSCFA
jgi:hypothetical protein